MPQYLYQMAYTAESLAAQIREPRDRLETAARPVLEAVGGTIKAAQTTKLLSGDQWISALGKAGAVAKAYKPAR